MSTPLTLSSANPFAQGGNRLCFVHPHDPQRCIKVRRPDFSLADRRRRKGFPKNLKPLSSFDDNREERQVMLALDKRFGAPAYELISRCYGFEATDMGPGLVSELIRNADGSIAHTLKQYLWDHGLDMPCQQALAQFSERWRALAIPSRDLLLHNIVVEKNEAGNIQRLVVIDGLGSGTIWPLALTPTSALQRRAQRKLTNLQDRIEQLLSLRGSAEFPGYHGQLLHDGTTQDAGDVHE